MHLHRLGPHIAARLGRCSSCFALDARRTSIGSVPDSLPDSDSAAAALPVSCIWKQHVTECHSDPVWSGGCCTQNSKSSRESAAPSRNHEGSTFGVPPRRNVPISGGEPTTSPASTSPSSDQCLDKDPLDSFKPVVGGHSTRRVQRSWAGSTPKPTGCSPSGGGGKNGALLPEQHDSPPE